jgi:hypothetical protein
MSSHDRIAPSLNGQARMTTASPTADELLTQFQRIERAWQAAEEKLAATHVPIDVRVKVRDEWIGPPCSVAGEMVVYLAYCKVKGNRRVCVIEESTFHNAYPGEEQEVDVKPVTECPVDVRLEMFDAFKKLYDEANAVAKSYVPKIRERVDQFEASLQWIDL